MNDRAPGASAGDPGGRLRGALPGAVALALAAFAFYAATLAPTVLWGDDAELQRLAASQGEVNPGRGHALWVEIARVVQLVPWGDPARRANLVSAIFGALTLPLVYGCVLLLTGRRDASLLAAAALGVSHTFWLHCVRAEVYTLHLFLLGAVSLLAISWALRPERRALVVSAFFLAGVGFQNHLLMATVLPALGCLLVMRAPAPRWRLWLPSLAALLAGAAPYLIAQVPAAMDVSFGTILTTFSPWRVSARELALGAAYHLYQFPAALFAAAAGAWVVGRRSAAAGWFLGITYASGAAFAGSFHVNDQYVFYLPCYLVVAIVAGAGASEILLKAPRRSLWPVRSLLALAFVALPVTLYAAAPAIFRSMEKHPVLKVRAIPGRDPSFFLWPPKNGYTGARAFATGALDVMPEGAVILAEWTSAQPILYLQKAEGLRPDVIVKQLGAGWGKQVPYLAEQSRTRELFIAGTGEHFDMEEIRALFDVVPAGPVYRLVPKAP